MSLDIYVVKYIISFLTLFFSFIIIQLSQWSYLIEDINEKKSFIKLTLKVI